MSILRTQLERAHVCRSLQKWDLYEVSEWLNFREDKNDLRSEVNRQGLLLQPSNYYSRQDKLVDKLRGNSSMLDDFYNTYYDALETIFPGVREILNLYQGKLALCGGFFSNPRNTEDVDLFFYNCTPMEAQTIIEEICRMLPGLLKAKGMNSLFNLEFTRNQETSNIYYREKKAGFPTKKKIQFIHRIYPSLAHIIGGFDVQASMIAMDGERIVSNVMGAWCFINSTIVADISRCSTSFIYRLSKYRNRGYNVVFPGMDASKKLDLIEEVNIKEKSFTKTLSEFIDQNGYRLRRWNHDYGYGGGGRIFNMPLLEKINPDSVEIIHGMWLKLNYEKRGEIKTPLGSNPQIQDYGVGESGVLYGSDQNSQASTNVVSLIKGNIKGFSTKLVTLEPYRPPNWSIIKDGFEIFDDYEEAFQELFENPFAFSTHILVSLLGGYQNIPIKFRKENLLKVLALSYTMDPRFLEQRFQEYRANHSDEIKEIMRSRMQSNILEFQENLKTVTWMTQDPQRQWSSTIHPECLSAQEFYKGSWNGFTIFQWEILREFFIALRNPGSPFFRMSKYVLKMIIWWVPFV